MKFEIIKKVGNFTLVNASTIHEADWRVFDGAELIIADVAEVFARTVFEQVVSEQNTNSQISQPIKTKKPQPIKNTSKPVEIKGTGQKIWTKEEIKSLLKTSDTMVGRSLLQLWNYQTIDEQNSHETKYENGVGFSAFDAEFLSDCARQYERTKSLSRKQLAVCRNKLQKYSSQLSKIANGTL